MIYTRKHWEVVANTKENGQVFCLECMTRDWNKQEFTGAICAGDLSEFEGGLVCDKCKGEIK